MYNRGMNLPESEFMIFVVECVSQNFFGGDKATAYAALRMSGVWSWYLDNYETTHTLGAGVLLNEIKEKLSEKGLLQ